MEFLKKYIKQNKSKIVIVLSIILFWLPLGQAYQNKVFSPHFVDEEDNLVLGKYLLKNETLYRDLFSHHQPLGYIFSAEIQNVTDPNSIYLLIKRHREFVIAWSFIWAVVLVARFGAALFLTIITFELTKIYLLGNLFLAESLSVYPLLYLTSFAYVQRRYRFEYLLIGILVGLLVFLLSPLWPVISLLVLIIFWKNWQLKKMIFSIVGFCLILFCVLPFISIPEYINDAYLINFQYYIPQASKESWLITAVKAIFSPVLTLTTNIPDSQIQWLMKILSIIFLINLLFLIVRKQIKLLLITVLILGISNIRFVQPGLQYYSGFHILPWFVLLIFFSFYLTLNNLEHFKNKWAKIFLIILIFVALVTALNTAGKSLFVKTDMDRDFYINYSRQFDFGTAVKIMKLEHDTLFVVPDEWLVYWQGDINHATKMINYYAWMTYVPQLNNIVEINFQTNPPTFFYCDCNGGYFGLEKYWDLYTPVKKDGKDTKLMMLKEKIKSITNKQQAKLKFYNFTID